MFIVQGFEHAFDTNYHKVFHFFYWQNDVVHIFTSYPMGKFDESLLTGR